jgi:bacillopeptidase F (M6 metalloprotease family)
VHGGTQSFHANDPGITSDQRLVSPEVALPAAGSSLNLQFWNWQQMEPSFGGCWDGGVVEISTNGGSTWTPLPTSLMLTDPYDGPVTGLGDLEGWCGDPQDWLNSVVNLDAYAGQTARFRFRLGSDSSVSREGWYVDDVKVQSCAVFAVPLFADGFDDGTTSAWSSVLP